MSIAGTIEKKIREYNPKGGLERTAITLRFQLSIRSPRVGEHAERVALLAEAVAKKMEKDAKATFFGGLLHDTGKDDIPNYLFDGRDITRKEYSKVKKHPKKGYQKLKKKHLFTACCAGTHHAMSENGYGLTLRNIPKKWDLRTVKKLLEIATIVAICDYIDAALNRDGVMKSDPEGSSGSLQERLEKKFPDDIVAIRIALRKARKIKKQ